VPKQMKQSGDGERTSGNCQDWTHEEQALLSPSLQPDDKISAPKSAGLMSWQRLVGRIARLLQLQDINYMSDSQPPENATNNPGSKASYMSDSQPPENATNNPGSKALGLFSSKVGRCQKYCSISFIFINYCLNID
jgi:hypothetical protein